MALSYDRQGYLAPYTEAVVQCIKECLVDKAGLCTEEKAERLRSLAMGLAAFLAENGMTQFSLKWVDLLESRHQPASHNIRGILGVVWRELWRRPRLSQWHSVTTKTTNNENLGRTI